MIFMNVIEFKEISLKNLDEVIGLEVGPDQTSLAADNLYSIARPPPFRLEIAPGGWSFSSARIRPGRSFFVVPFRRPVLSCTALEAEY
jgi:hypothetical protein